jgi:hypothetical protein
MGGGSGWVAVFSFHLWLFRLGVHSVLAVDERDRFLFLSKVIFSLLWILLRRYFYFRKLFVYPHY